MGWTKTRSQIAHAKRHDPDADVTALKQQLKAERLEEHVARVVAEAPPLTPEQRDRIAALLQGGAAPPGSTTASDPAEPRRRGNEPDRIRPRGRGTRDEDTSALLRGADR